MVELPFYGSVHEIGGNQALPATASEARYGRTFLSPPHAEFYAQQLSGTGIRVVLPTATATVEI